MLSKSLVRHPSASRKPSTGAMCRCEFGQAQQFCHFTGGFDLNGFSFDFIAQLATRKASHLLTKPLRFLSKAYLQRDDLFETAALRDHAASHFSF
jgi:hypothetical protein